MSHQGPNLYTQWGESALSIALYGYSECLVRQWVEIARFGYIKWPSCRNLFIFKYGNKIKDKCPFPGSTAYAYFMLWFFLIFFSVYLVYSHQHEADLFVLKVRLGIKFNIVTNSSWNHSCMKNIASQNLDCELTHYVGSNWIWYSYWNILHDGRYTTDIGWNNIETNNINLFYFCDLCRHQVCYTYKQQSLQVLLN